MALVQVEKVYKDKKDVDDFNKAREEIAKKRDAVSSVFQYHLSGKLAACLEKIRAVEAVNGMLDELTEGQIRTFEEEVRRRQLF